VTCRNDVFKEDRMFVKTCAHGANL
jgi:hypothetical protein